MNNLGTPLSFSSYRYVNPQSVHDILSFYSNAHSSNPSIYVDYVWSTYPDFLDIYTLVIYLSGINKLFASSDKTTPLIMVNGNFVEYPCVQDADKTLIPLTLLSKYMNYKLDWNESKKEITLESEDSQILFKLNKRECYKKNEKMEINFPITMIENKSYVGLDFIEKLDLHVTYNDDIIPSYIPDTTEDIVFIPRPIHETHVKIIAIENNLN